MILALLVCIPFLGGLLAWALCKAHARVPQVVSFGALVVDMCLALWVWFFHPALSVRPGAWLIDAQWPWISRMGISLHMALDGLSLLLIMLTLILASIAVAILPHGQRDRNGFYHFNLLWSISATIAVFLAVDLFLFYVSWELMIVPMYFVVALWGGENRTRAAVKFFVFTQASGLFLLLAILGLYFIHGASSGIYTFDYNALLHTTLSAKAGFWLMLGFFLAFAVKLGAFPFHGWLPDAYGEAPVAGSIVLAGVMSKTGAYGLMRFALPLFPNASSSFALVAMILGTIAIVYGAVVALGQTDLKRLVAYTSVSHMGFVVLGIYVWGHLSLQGVVIQMISHGITVAALFVIVDALERRVGTRDISRFGGLWQAAPRLGGFTMVFALALLGLPGLGTFTGEVLILLDTFRMSIPVSVIPLAGTIFAVVYSLWMVQRIFMGEGPVHTNVKDCSARELSILGALVVLIAWLGMYPSPFLRASDSAVKSIRESAPGARPDINASMERLARIIK